MRRLQNKLLQLYIAKDGQATVEYILMLGTVVVIFSAFVTAFHKDIIKWLFMFIGEMVTPNG